MSAITVHVFAPSGYHTYDGGKAICTCGSVEGERVHQLPEVAPEAREIDARRIGEGIKT